MTAPRQAPADRREGRREAPFSFAPARLWQAFVAAVVRMSATRTNYWIEFAIDLALGVGCIAAAVLRHDAPLVAMVPTLALGLVMFSLIEYGFHRWLFHGGVPLLAEGHARHHARPRSYDSLPFFIPLFALLALLGSFALLMPFSYALLLTGAISLGYVVYGLSHFVIHHTRFASPLARRWAGGHHVHHFHPGSNFGVSTILWDVVLGTRYAANR